MFFKVIIIFLSLATFSRGEDVCLCCGDQTIDQNLRDCRNIARQATKNEAKNLEDFCYHTETYFEQYQSDYRLALMEQFDVNSVTSLKLPTSNCHSMLNSLDGLLYLVPEDTSELFKYFEYANQCYAGLQIENRNGEEIQMPGVMCYNQYEKDDVMFKGFYDSHMYKRSEIANTTRYLYFVRKPIFYKMTKISYNKGERRNVYDVEKKDLGQYAMCNDGDIEENFTITINYKKVLDINFNSNSYKLFPCVYSNLKPYAYSHYNNINLATVFEILDEDNDYAPRKVPVNNYCRYNLPYTVNVKRKIDLGTTIPPHSCASATVTAYVRRYETEISATFDVHLANMGNFTDRITLKKPATIIEYENEDATVEDINISYHNNIIIIIPIYTAYLILGCVVGMIFFCLLLFVVIKSMNFVEKANFRDNWHRTAERLSIAASDAAAFTKAKGEILGDKLIRLGDYICNVGNWIYLEIK